MTLQPQALPQNQTSRLETRDSDTEASFRAKSILLMHLFREMRSLERQRRSRGYPYTTSV